MNFTFASGDALSAPGELLVLPVFESELDAAAPPWNRLEQAVAAALLKAARTVFAEMGYGAAGVRDIVRRTDLASGPAAGQGGSFADRFEITSSTADGPLVTMTASITAARRRGTGPGRAMAQAAAIQAARTSAPRSAKGSGESQAARAAGIAGGASPAHG